MTDKCVVCKQEINEQPSTMTEQGLVHTGECQRFLQEKVLSESTSDISETQLLID